MPPEQVLLCGAKGRFCQFKIDLNSSLETKTETTPKPYNQTSLVPDEPSASLHTPLHTKKEQGGASFQPQP